MQIVRMLQTSIGRLFPAFLILLLLPVAARGAAPVYAEPAAQTAGAVTVSADGGSASYGSLKLAFDAINAGTHAGSVTITINASTSELATAVLNASGSGSASYTGVTISPASTGLTIGGRIDGALIDLNGADNVTIDGRVGGSGSAPDLTIENLSSGINASAVRFANAASDNIIRWVILRGASTGPTNGVVLFSTSIAGSGGNSNNTIESCHVRDSTSGTPVNLIYSATLDGQNVGNIIQNNDLYNFFSATVNEMNGVNLASNSDSWTISGNRFYQTVSRSPSPASTTSAIKVSAGSNHIISSNNIGGQGPLAGTSPWTFTAGKFTAISLSVEATTSTHVDGNTIENFDWRSTSGSSSAPGVWCGIYLNSGNVAVGSNFGNKIGGATDKDRVLITSTANGSISFGICSNPLGTGPIAISNNTLSSITVGSSESVSHGFIGVYAAHGEVSITDNLIGSTDPTYGISASTPSTLITSQPLTGIHVDTGGTVLIQHNTVANLSNSYAGGGITEVGLVSNQTRGIVTTGGTNTITNNTVRHLSSASTSSSSWSGAAIIGISAMSQSPTAQTVSGNTVHALSETANANVQVVGIVLMNGGVDLPAYSNSVSDNAVTALKLTEKLGTARIAGIYDGGSGYETNFINNIVDLGVDEAGFSLSKAYEIYGIYHGSGRANFYHNSIFIGGSIATAPTANIALLSAPTLPARIFKNNVFVNKRSNATGTIENVAAVLAGSLSNPTMTTDNNLYYNAAGTGAITVRNGTSGTIYKTLAAWAAASGQDQHSLSADPRFVDPNAMNLHIDVSSPTISPAERGGTPIAGVTTDYDGDLRNPVAPDIGADEFTPRLSGVYNSITVPSGEVYTLGAATTINDQLVLNGTLSLDAYSLTLGPNATVGGAPGASSMIVTGGAGQVCKVMTQPSTFTFPVGDSTGTPEYSPVTLTFTEGVFALGAQICVGVVNAAHPAGEQDAYPIYLKRYWRVSQTGITSWECNATFNYVEADVTGGNEDKLSLWKYDAPGWSKLSIADAVNNQLAGTVTSFSEFTGRSTTPLAVKLAFFRVELNSAGLPLLTWETVTELDNLGFNVYRSESSRGPWDLVSGALIASAMPGSTAGALYTWTDTSAGTGAPYWYLLEDIDIRGVATTHGPETASGTEVTPTAVSLQKFSGQNALAVWPVGLMVLLVSIALLSRRFGD